MQGKKDKYYSESLVAKAEREVEFNNKLSSYGFGSEYKYDWGHYLTKTFSSNMGGHVKNIGIFINWDTSLIKIKLSFHGRNDNS